jgi:radical SAM protein with 4Fe4S-binding SPASM domain
MDKAVFIERNLFPIETSNYLSGFEADYLLYSPLSKSFIFAGKDKLELLQEELISDGKVKDEDIQSQLIDTAIIPEESYAHTPQEIFALTILPNNICNFSCSYCYAAQGHSKDTLSKEKLKCTLDFFIDPERISRRDLYISFGGGGEPFISWDIVKYAIEYGSSLAEKHGFKLNFSFASNGSIINDEIVESIKKYRIKANISFDILEEIQNLQRKNYLQVCETLHILLDNEIYPTVNSVITPANVALQEQMVEHAHNCFPKLKRLSFDSVVDGNLFDKPVQLNAFYDKYIRHFFTAQELGEKYDITVSCIKHRNLELIKTRACAGGFDLTPNGKFSMCFFVSSPKEKLYNRFIYGEVTDNALQFDEDKFKELVAYNAENNERCRSCFIKWHCGGGCLYHSKAYSQEMLDVMCDFQRKFSFISLLTNVTPFKELVLK